MKTLENTTLTNNLTDRSDHILFIDSPDIILGSARNRYFGFGYKNTIHFINNCEIKGNILIADLHIIWAKLWSKKQGSYTAPHVSSLDFYVVSMLLAENYLRLHGNIKESCIKRVWVENFYCKAGSGAIEEDTIPCSCRKIYQSQNKDLIVYSFKIFIEKVVIILKINQPRCNSFKRTCLSICNNHEEISTGSYSLLNDKLNYYSSVYKKLDRVVSNILINKETREIRANINILNWTCYDIIRGTGSEYMPYTTFGDLILIAGQMTQMLLFSLYNITRDTASNLWLREIKCNNAKKVSSQTTACVSILSSNVILVQGKHFQNLLLSFHFGNSELIAECKAAYQIC